MPPTSQERQMFQMIKAGFDAIVKSIVGIKVIVPETKVDMSGVEKAMNKTTECMQMMIEKDSEPMEIILKIE